MKPFSSPEQLFSPRPSTLMNSSAFLLCGFFFILFFISSSFLSELLFPVLPAPFAFPVFTGEGKKSFSPSPHQTGRNPKDLMFTDHSYVQCSACKMATLLS